MDITILILVIGILAVIGIATFAHGIAAERAARINWVAIQAAEAENLRLRTMLASADREHFVQAERDRKRIQELERFIVNKCLVQRPRSKWFAKIHKVTPAGVFLRWDRRLSNDSWVPFRE